MFIVRETFIAKPGYAGKLANMMKEEMRQWKDFQGYVMLDLVTNYNTIVIEYELKSLADFEKMMTEQKKEMEKKMQADSKPPAYTEMYQTGKREIFKVVE